MEGAQTWSDVSVAVVSATGWSRASIAAGQRELERIRREVDAAFTALVIADGGDDRDAAARVARTTNVSTRCARERVRIARVCDALPAAFGALASGDISAEHVALLEPVLDDPDASGLVEVAASQTPEDFRDTVRRYQLAKDPADVRKRQRNARSLSFYNGAHGCLGIRGLLTPVDGDELRNALTAIADAQWKKEHPDRAPIRGGHGGDSWNARIADALMTLLRGQTTSDGNSSKTANTAKPKASAKPSAVITIDAKTLEAELIGHGPITIEDALEAAARGELYAAILDMNGEILNLGRSKRFANAIQNLALIVRDKQSVMPGCDGHWTKTDAHHTIEFEDGGLTDVKWLARVCEPHHTYLHTNGLRLIRHDGVWIVQRAGPAESDTG
jgi:Domain of unknown function (DUF222)